MWIFGLGKGGRGRGREGTSHSLRLIILTSMAMVLQ